MGLGVRFTMLKVSFVKETDTARFSGNFIYHRRGRTAGGPPRVFRSGCNVARGGRSRGTQGDGRRTCPPVAGKSRGGNGLFGIATPVQPWSGAVCSQSGAACWISAPALSTWRRARATALSTSMPGGSSNAGKIPSLIGDGNMLLDPLRVMMMRRRRIAHFELWPDGRVIEIDAEALSPDAPADEPESIEGRDTSAGQIPEAT